MIVGTVAGLERLETAMATALKTQTAPLLDEAEIARRRKINEQSNHDGVLEGVKPSKLILELGERWAVGEITREEMRAAVIADAISGA